MKNHKFIPSLVAITIALSLPLSRAKAQQNTWAQSYGLGGYNGAGQTSGGQYASGYDYPVAITKMPDGGVVVAGELSFSFPKNGGTPNAVLVRFAPDGTILWQRDLYLTQTDTVDHGGGNVEIRHAPSFVYQVAADVQGNVFICGGKGNTANGALIPFVAKFSSAGDLVWQNAITGAHFLAVDPLNGGPPRDFAAGVTVCYYMALTPDGGVVITLAQGHTPYEPYTAPAIAKFNSDGSLGMYNAFAYGVQYAAIAPVAVSQDGSKYLLTYTYSNSDAPVSFALLILDASGNVIGERVFAPTDGRREYQPVSIIRTADNGFASLTRVEPDGQRGNGFVVRKFKPDLTTEIFEKMIYDQNRDATVTGNSLAEAADGTLIIGGHQGSAEPYSGQNGSDDAMIMKLGADGTPQFSTLFGGPAAEADRDTGAYVSQTPDGGYAFAADTLSYGVDVSLNQANWWIAKTDANRRIAGFTGDMLEKPLSYYGVVDSTRAPTTANDFTPVAGARADTDTAPAFVVRDPSTLDAPDAPEEVFQASGPRIMSSRTAEAVVDQHFSYQILALFFDPSATLTYSASGLPNNFVIDPKTGVISGVAKAGTETTTPIAVTLQVTDGTNTATAKLSLTISDGLPILTINGSNKPADNLADTVLQFAVDYPGSIAGRVLTIQASTDPNPGNPAATWNDLTNGTGGAMTPDFSSGRYILNTTGYPAQNGVAFRALLTAPGHNDVTSNIVGPFNLASSKTRAAQTIFRLIRNGLRADLDFRATEVSPVPNIALRVQFSTTPGIESSWGDVTDAAGGVVTMQPKDTSHYSVATNAGPKGDGIYFRAIGAASGYVDSLSNIIGPYSLATIRPAKVSFSSPSGTDVDHPQQVRQGADGSYQYQISVIATQGDRPLDKLHIAIDGDIVATFDNATNGQLYTLTRSTTLLGDHVIEAIAIDDLGVVGRAATGPQYIRILPPATTAERAAGSSAGQAATFRREIYTVANSGGDWQDPTTWKDSRGNSGTPTSTDFVIIGNATVKNVIGTVFAMTVNGGHLSGGQLQVDNMLTIANGTFDGGFLLTIKTGAVCEFLNSSDVVIDGVLQNQGTINIHGARGLKGVGTFVNIGTVNFQSALLPSEMFAATLPLDPRAVQAGNFDISGKVGQTFIGPSNKPVVSPSGAAVIQLTGAAIVSNDGGSLIGHDGGSLIGHDGGSLIGHDGGSLIGHDGGSLINQDGASVLSHDGGTLINHDGASLVTDAGAGVLGGRNNGLISYAATSTSASTNARAASSAPGITVNGGEVDLDAIFLAGPVTLNGGIISGTGVIAGDLANNGGYISPGHSPGTLTITGNFTQASGGSLIIEAAGGSDNEFDQLRIGGSANLGGKLDLRLLNGYAPLAGDTFNAVSYKSASGSFASISSNAQVSFSNTGAVATVDSAKPSPGTGQPLNISTRMEVLQGDNILIGGFIVYDPTGANASKKVLIRALGPSLPVSNTLADPLLELHKPDGSIVTNDNWQSGDTSQIPNGFAPANPKESLIVATLPPGAYTAQVKGADGGTGIGLVEAYDLNSDSTSKLANISTRGFVDTGDNVMIGGFIVGGQDPNNPLSSEPGKVLVRGIGPSLATSGVQGALAATTLELHDANGAVISNEGWRSTQEAEIIATTIAPKDDKDCAILQTLAPGAYTAILRGANNTTGIGLVEAYNLQ